jgi:hypothetical protein
MNMRSFSAGVLAITMLAGFPLTLAADEKSDFEAALSDAQAARKKAASVGGEWRDTGKIIKEAKAAAEMGDYETAMKLADKAQKQGELGYEQAMSQQDAGLPDYLK